MKKCKHCNYELPPKLKGLQCKVCHNGLNRYGLTRLDQIALFKQQNNKCAICLKPMSLFNRHHGGIIDHCHTTNKVRGIVCNRCNSLLSHFDEFGLSLFNNIKSYLKV